MNPPRPPRLDTARELVRRCWLNPTEEGLREARRSLVRRMWRARRLGMPGLRAEFRALYLKICEQQRQRDWEIAVYERSARYRARTEPHQVMREQVQRQGKSRAVGLNIPQETQWVSPVSSTAPTVLHQPPPGSAPYLLRPQSNVAEPPDLYPGRLNDEFEHYVVIGAPNWQAAQREYWRHVANRACLAILADHRVPAISPRPSSPSSSPPSAEPRNPVGSDLFLVQAEAIQVTVKGQASQTQPLAFEMLVDPDLLPMTSRLALEALRDWPAPQSIDPLFKYRRRAFRFERREGLSGDIITLFEHLLRPHAAVMLEAL